MKLNQKKQLETFKQAVVGASNVLSQDVQFNAIVDTLVEAREYSGSS